MESPKEQVVLHTTISEAEPSTPTRGSFFRVTGLAARFWLTQDHPFTPGDRVRITITKEPAADALPR